MKKSVLLSFFLLFFLVSYEQKAEPSNSNIWLSLGTDLKLNSKMNLYSEANFRYDNFFKSLNQQLYRVSLDYSLKDNISIGLSFVKSDQYNVTTENRICQQFQKKFFAGNKSYVVRCRNEVRWKPEVYKGLFDLTDRCRLLIGYSFPVDIIQKKQILTISDECFVNLTETINGKRFDQNRISILLKNKLGKNIFLEMGYMRQLSYQSSLDELFNVNVIKLNLLYTNK